MSYKNFNIAVYCRINDLVSSNMDNFSDRFHFIQKHINVSKVYLETFRDSHTIERDKILKIKNLLEDSGVKTSGSITTSSTSPETGFSSLCYTSQNTRNTLKSVVELTAEIFDEIILDDFYFTNCKCESCINSKNGKSWAEFRLNQMKEASEELVLKPAKLINPDVNIIIKYPNWYEHYAETGYNLREEPLMFDMIYTGTETRNPLYTHQHLPRYLSYFMMRYMENVKPGKNGGGWFDPYDCSYNLSSYVEQANLTLFGKAKEVTLFCMDSLTDESSSIFVPLIGHTFSLLDQHTEHLGTPVGISSYIPFEPSAGEAFLHNYLGMLGIPFEPSPYFHENQNNIFLTEAAASDSEIIQRLSKFVINGGSATITSGFVKAMQDKGFGNIANIRYTGRKAAVNKYALSEDGINFNSCTSSVKKVLIPQIEYCTNDSWQLIAGLGEDNSFPILLQVNYGKGHLFVLTIPDDFGDIYQYPADVLMFIRQAITGDFYVQLDAPSKICLFAYDNNTFIVESFLSHFENISLIINKSGAKLIDPVTNSVLEGTVQNDKTIFRLNIAPSSYKILRII